MRLKDWQIGLGLFFIALLVKLIYIKAFGSAYMLSPDGLLYSDIAENVLKGNGFVNSHIYGYGEDGSLMAMAEYRDYVVGPVYPLILAAIYGIFGLKSYGAVIIVQAVFNALSALLAYKIGEKLWDKRGGLLSFILMLFYPGFSLWSQYVLTEATYVLSFLLFFYVLLLYQKRAEGKGKTWQMALVLGGVIGLSNLVRPFLLLAVPVIFFWMLWIRGWSLKPVLKDFILMTVMVCVVMSPWWVRNYLKYDRFIVATNYGAYEIYAGNNPHTITHEAFYKSSLSYDPAVKEEVEKLPVLEQEKEYSRLAKEYILAHPLAFVERTWEKAVNVFWKPVTPGEGQAYQMAGHEWDRWYLYLGGLGALLALFKLKKYGFLLLFTLYYSSAVSAITVVDGGRYRLPIMTAVVFLAALSLRTIGENKYVQRIAKRVLDLAVSIPLLILVSPLWLFIVLWIRFDSPGKALFCQTRVGKGGKPFTIYKFRTMIPNADALIKDKLEQVKDIDSFVFQEKDDPRITRSGRFLRKTSLDELPQLLNILLGNMSLIGPRPEVPEIVRHYTSEQRLRLEALPGVTGLAQVNGRSELTLGETMAYDLEYVRKWSFALDVKILWKTLFVVFSGKGAF